MTNGLPSDEAIGINLRKLAIFEAILVSCIILAGTTANYIITQCGLHPDSAVVKIMYRFDLGHEPSLPQLVSSIGHLGCCFLMSLIGLIEWKARNPIVRSWVFLACVSLYMSIDESIMIHEMIDRPLKEQFGLGHYLFLPWTLVAMLAVVGVGLASIRLLRIVDATTRTLFVVSGIVFVAGAVGMETVAGMIFSKAGSEELGVQTMAHVISQAIEEGLEFSGVAIFFWALVNYLRKRVGELRVRFVI